ncbi:MAG: Hsp20/alpha crystallin family protein [Planctomycetota bacterium]
MTSKQMTCTTRPTAPTAVRTRRPRADIHETDAAFLLTLELPGVAEGDVDVQLEAETLRIRAKRPAWTGPDGFRLEYGSAAETVFERSFLVPEGLDAEAISAELTAGLLRVTLPKTGPRRRTIDVKVG